MKKAILRNDGNSRKAGIKTISVVSESNILIFSACWVKWKREY